jgi:hypothetical protein
MEDIKKLADLRDALNSSANLYWGRQVDIEHKIASAWLAYAEKHDVDAEASMRAATKLEETTETHDTLSPGPIGSTAHEALGELLLLRGDAPGALASFEKSLELAKRRSRSYYGAIKAAAIMGDADVQKKYLTALAEVCGFKDGAVHATVDLSSPALGGLPCAAIAHD